MQLFGDLIPLSQAVGLFPVRPHTATIHRWSKRGCNGKRLATVRIGSRIYTTRADVDDFLIALNPPTSATPAAGDDRRLVERVARADRELATDGI